jgi:hypothetical protein
MSKNIAMVFFLAFSRLESINDFRSWENVARTVEFHVSVNIAVAYL